MYVSLFLHIQDSITHMPGTAGAGSLILEFATLSRLTGDDRFEKAAFKAFFAIWNRKSDINLVGNTIDTWTGVRRATSVLLASVSLHPLYRNGSALKFPALERALIHSSNMH